jgi:hypothetical protein
MCIDMSLYAILGHRYIHTLSDKVTSRHKEICPPSHLYAKCSHHICFLMEWEKLILGTTGDYGGIFDSHWRSVITSTQAHSTATSQLQCIESLTSWCCWPTILLNQPNKYKWHSRETQSYCQTSYLLSIYNLRNLHGCAVNA